MSISKPLKALLNSLESISEDYDEIFDTDVRESLGEAIYCGFVSPKAGYTLPKSFEMFDETGDKKIRKALDAFLTKALPIAAEQGWTAQQRLDAFQDLDVSSTNGLTYDEFFGHLESL